MRALRAEQDPPGLHRLDDPGEFDCRRFQRRSIAHQFHPDEQTVAAHVADELVASGQ